jgi:hypothetical protein
MPHSHSHTSGPSLLPIERPHCPKCNNHMALASIMPGPKGFDIRNFECDKCDHIETRMIRTDPMKADSANWINSDLRPPK